MSEDLKLLPCSFCGGEAEIEHIHSDNGYPEVYYREWDFYAVKCKACGASTGNHSSEKTAADYWNKRA